MGAVGAGPDLRRRAVVAGWVAKHGLGALRGGDLIESVSGEAVVDERVGIGVGSEEEVADAERGEGAADAEKSEGNSTHGPHD